MVSDTTVFQGQRHRLALLDPRIRQRVHERYKPVRPGAARIHHVDPPDASISDRFEWYMRKMFC
jgi:hypothetical protein